MIRTAFGAWRRLASRAALAFASIALASCGSGGVSNDNATAAGTGPVSISPETVVLYSELPTSFSLSGGSGSYLVTSSDQSLVPVASNIRINRFTVVPGDVGSDTSVTLTVRDANNATAVPATAALTVKPRTISSTVTITPSSSQSAACGTAICAGGDAQVSVVLSLAGVPLADREVRFDVISGDVAFITSPTGVTPEGQSPSITTTTDSTGTARVRIRALSGAPPQTALLRITDVASGFSQTASVAISSLTNAPLSANPTTVDFTGPDSNSCATGGQALVIVAGGTPPYTISQPGPFFVNPPVLNSSRSTFTITPSGQCSTGSAIAVVDATGKSVTVTATNSVGTIAPQSFVIAPKEVTFTDCGQQADVVAAGGTGRFFSSNASSVLIVSSSGNGIFTISLPANAPQSAVMPGTDLQVGISDGQTALPVTVHITGNSTCPP